MTSRFAAPRIGIALGASLAAMALTRFIVRLSSSNPAIWERDIRAFEMEDQRNSPPERPIVFTGSSSIRFWDTLARDMEPLRVLNRGFGGAQMHQVTYYADRIVLQYAPRAVVVYAGENDIAGVFFSRRQTAAEVALAFQQFCATLHGNDPDLPIYVVAIKPPKRRWKAWPEMQRANQLIADYCAGDARLHFIDVRPAMLDDRGRARAELFRRDGIHLNGDGYEVWKAVIKPILLQAFA